MNSETRTTTTERVLTRSVIKRALPFTELTAEEEIVLRMRYGIGIDSDTRLSYRGTGNEELQIRLALIECAILDELEERNASSTTLPMDDFEGL